ncbi:thioredoxin family protein [Flammeovirgaceae bacterium SG7u.111]|nr:thioredoxin family protein [Flammeovirgaceae bacterium SG7u.132]WPO37316.1 thioredoxin family protein [Flammeovirgaceae bacterium SG7u.111]
MKKLLLISISLALFSFVYQHELGTGNGVGIGEKAPDFKLKNVDGKEYSFENIMDSEGKKPEGYIVIFTCNTCPVAQANEQRIIDLHKKYGAKGYPVVAIQPNDPKIKAGDSFEEMKKKNYPFLYLFDEGQTVYPQYGATKTPEVFIVDKDLKVRYHGAIDDNARDADGVDEKFVEKAIGALMKGEAPSPAKTKAIGCGIKAGA